MIQNDNSNVLYYFLGDLLVFFVHEISFNLQKIYSIFKLIY